MINARELTIYFTKKKNKAILWNPTPLIWNFFTILRVAISYIFPSSNISM